VLSLGGMMGSKDIWGKFHKALKNKEWSDAVAIMDIVIETEPGNPNHYLKKGDVCQKKGDSAEAANSYLKAAWHLGQKGFLKKALAVYKMVLRIDPDNKEAIETTNKIIMDLETPKQPTLKEVTSDKAPAEETIISTIETPPEEGLIERTSYEDPAEEGIHETEGIVTEESASETTVESPDDDIIESTSLVDETATPDEKKTTSPSDLLSPFTDIEIKEVLSRSEVKEFSPGQTVVREGDTGDSVYIIKSGTVSVVAHILGREIDLATLAQGDMFGEVAYLTGRPRTANVIANEDIEVYEINKNLLDEIIEKRPEIMSQVNEIYNARVQDTIEKVKKQ
jgi:tetratricopeptide (TPR) repeat protein